MKNLRIFAILLTSAVFLIACEKQHPVKDGVDIGVDAAKMVWAEGPNMPTSDGGIIPEVIPGENKGGNRTCEEVYRYFMDDQELMCGDGFLCGEKVDWEDGGFVSDFPEGLTVHVDGIHISFSITGCLEMHGEYWKVGAVIVKGSNAANVYWYPDGTTADQGLAAPGNKHMVSNLTFCFVPCDYEEPDKVIGVKIKDNVAGEYATTSTGGWYIQCVPFVNMSYEIYRDHYMVDPVADLFITDADQDGELDAVITMRADVGFLIDDAYVFFGDAGACNTDYGSFPNQAEGLGQTDEVIFYGPLSE